MSYGQVEESEETIRKIETICHNTRKKKPAIPSDAPAHMSNTKQTFYSKTSEIRAEMLEHFGTRIQKTLHGLFID